MSPPLKNLPTYRRLPWQTSGVYFFVDGEEIAYIGRSDQLRLRLAYHPWLSGRYAGRYDVLLAITDPENSRILEEALIRELRPPLNHQFARRKSSIAPESIPDPLIGCDGDLMYGEAHVRQSLAAAILEKSPRAIAVASGTDYSDILEAARGAHPRTKLAKWLGYEKATGLYRKTR